MTIVESKSLLAKLLAEENISVQHRKTQTAYFEVKQRILVCPILKDMPAELYDLLMGHEVGHALYTPPEGWHDALTENESPGFKSYLNVVEDARIERKIKSKFPGLRTSFYKGYKNLSDRDFFGIKGRKLQTLPLIDRINLHFKLGILVDIKFSSKEAVIVERINDAETWEEVVQIAKDLYCQAKEDQKSQINDFDNLDLEDIENMVDSFQKEMGQQDDDNENEEESSSKQSTDDSKNSEEDGDEKSSYGNYDKSDLGDDFEDPSSITDKNFRQRERDLIDEKCIPLSYATVPKFNMREVLVPHKVVHAAIEAAGNTVQYDNQTTFECYKVTTKDFFEKNTRYINYMVKEFELRKNAKQFSRAAINKTGELDMKKISKHQLTDDIFRRITVVPQGKNHGLLLYLDLSGSMIRNMSGTIEQLLILTTFCRKVNIPFEVYGFSNSSSSLKLLLNRTNYSTSRDNGDISFDDDFHLKQYFSSSMSRSEYNQAMLNMMLMCKLYDNRHQYLVPSEHLFGTPLNEAIACSIDMAIEFRKRHRLEVLTTMFLTDGESDRFYDNAYEDGKKQNLQFKAGNSWHYNLMITHKDTKTSVMRMCDTLITKSLLELFKKVTQANLIGFFISGILPYKSTIKKVYKDFSVTQSPTFDAECLTAKKNKFFPIKGTGFDFYFVVPPGNELIINDEQIDAPAGINKNDLKKAFLKTMKSRAVNRVFLSRFCNTLSENM